MKLRLRSIGGPLARPGSLTMTSEQFVTIETDELDPTTVEQLRSYRDRHLVGAAPDDMAAFAAWGGPPAAAAVDDASVTKDDRPAKRGR